MIIISQNNAPFSNHLKVLIKQLSVRHRHAVKKPDQYLPREQSEIFFVLHLSVRMKRAWLIMEW